MNPMAKGNPRDWLYEMEWWKQRGYVVYSFPSDALTAHSREVETVQLLDDKTILLVVNGWSLVGRTSPLPAFWTMEIYGQGINERERWRWCGALVRPFYALLYRWLVARRTPLQSQRLSTGGPIGVWALIHLARVVLGLEMELELKPGWEYCASSSQSLTCRRPLGSRVFVWNTLQLTVDAVQTDVKGWMPGGSYAPKLVAFLKRYLFGFCWHIQFKIPKGRDTRMGTGLLRRNTVLGCCNKSNVLIHFSGEVYQQ